MTEHNPGEPDFGHDEGDEHNPGEPTFGDHEHPGGEDVAEPEQVEGELPG